MNTQWPKVKLGEVLLEQKQRIGTFDADNLPLLGVSNEKGLQRSGKPRISDMSRYLQVEKDWFAYNPMRINVGSVGWAQTAEQTGIISPDYVVFSCSERIHPSLLFSFLKHHRGLQEINNATAGSVRERLYFDKLAQIEFALPPLPEQRRIVARIEELAAQIQEARTLRQQADTEALAMIPSAMTETFRQLGEEYPTRKLTDLCDVVRGGSPRPAGSPLYYGGDIPFLKVGDLTKDDGMYVYGASATVNELGRQHSRYIEAETLMLTNSGATLGVPKITKTAGCFNDGSQAFLSLDPSVDKEFLYYLFKSKTDWFREQLARGQGQPNLNTDMTKQMDVPIPPIPKQRQIVAELDALQGEVDSLKRLQSETAAELDALLPSILDKAFKGGL